MEFTYDGKEKPEFIEWTEKNICDEICIYLQRHFNSQSITPSNVECIQVVVGGDHGDTAFLFDASVSVHLISNRQIDFELSVCELICHKDMGKLIKSTILTQLTQGLEIGAMWNLHIEMNSNRKLECEFKQT
jgi:hypothetical protein